MKKAWRKISKCFLGGLGGGGGKPALLQVLCSTGKKHANPHVNRNQHHFAHFLLEEQQLIPFDSDSDTNLG